MDVRPETAPAKSEYGGRTFHFCSTHCKEKFDKSPQSYTSEQPAKS
jgi:Cu+-exporting ATPase